MKRILVTGGNKGIGLAIATAILNERDDTSVLLGSRSAERGRAAVEALVRERPDRESRIEAIELDVASADSVTSAATSVIDRFGRDPAPLYAIVNNAGVGRQGDLRGTLQVNVFGVQRMCEAFLPLLDPAAGRIVIVSSAAGPNFVQACNPAMRRFFLDDGVDWPKLRALMEECIAIEGNDEAFNAKGLQPSNDYGFSKACVNSYMRHLARENPSLRINAYTPGFIATDLTRPFAEAQGKSPEEMGMKPPSAGAETAIFLLFGEPEGNGRYYGSDGKRSPLDRYRAPGDPPYTGD